MEGNESNRSSSRAEADVCGCKESTAPVRRHSEYTFYMLTFTGRVSGLCERQRGAGADPAAEAENFSSASVHEAPLPVIQKLVKKRCTSVFRTRERDETSNDSPSFQFSSSPPPETTPARRHRPKYTGPTTQRQPVAAAPRFREGLRRPAFTMSNR
ncbi:hypothetical protein GBF38_022248 [Nibea albiflora]|uniref:Uncharacterized protein n=1 Tax=Nibea albiflora TaxID=240163 RepID=A0ACB7FMG7_NIBAL|nr:hypothetical protein GBF38_022248 [Nibea albiflora]